MAKREETFEPSTHCLPARRAHRLFFHVVTKGGRGQRLRVHGAQVEESRMQSTTRRTVLELVHRGRARTRRDLSRLIGLSRSAVAQTVAELVAEGLLSEHVTDREERRG